MAHKTNYKDALFEQRKYRMQNNPDGTVTPIDETDYTQEGDRVGALELNKIGEALNALEQEMGKRELQTYTALSQLSLEAPVTLSQLITAMPDGSYAAIDCNGTSVVSDIPSGSAAGSLEVVKVGDSGSAKYTNTSNGQVYFWGNGQWYAALVDEMVLDTMEEIDANTDAGKVAGALAVKELSSELSGKLKNTIQLYSGTSFTGNIELSQPYNDFLLICIVVFYGTGGCMQQLIPPNILEITNEKNRNIVFMGHQNNSISMRFTDYNTCVVQLIGGTDNPYVAGIYGLR